MRYRLRSALAGGTLVLSSLVLAGNPTASSAQTVAAAGVYSGPAVPAGVTDHNSFATWLGSPVPYAVEFLDYTRPWAEIADPAWALDAWAQWISAQSGRRLVLSVPLLNNSSSGQLAQGASGAFDGNFRALAQNMVSRNLGSSVIRLGWEMNNSGFPWYAGTDPASFRTFYARVVTIMRSVPGAAFTFDWNANPGVQSGSTLTTFESFYPGDAYVDIIGLDVYDIKWMDSTSTPADRWSWMLSQQLGLNQHRAFAAAHGKPVSFPEWGLYRAGTQLGGGGDNPYFVDAMADWIASSNTSYQAFFDYDWGGGTLASFPNAQARIKLRFGSTATTPTTVAPTTTTTTVAPTTTTTVAPTTTTTVAPTTTTTVVQSSGLISNVRVAWVTKNAAHITWTTSSSASSEVFYGTSTPTSKAIGPDGVTTHAVTVSNLVPKTRYVFYVQSSTDSGSAAVSPTSYFVTAKR